MSSSQRGKNPYIRYFIFNSIGEKKLNKAIQNTVFRSRAIYCGIEANNLILEDFFCVVLGFFLFVLYSFSPKKK